MQLLCAGLGGRSLRGALDSPVISQSLRKIHTLSRAAFGAGILFIWDAAACGDWPQGCQGRASTALGGPLICKRHDKPVKSREGSNEGVREASVLGFQMKTSCFGSSLFQDKHDSMQP